jgi:hypothetical protein
MGDYERIQYDGTKKVTADTLKDMIVISENNFEDYLRIQKSGRYNMYSRIAVSATGLSIEIYSAIQKNYEKLMILYDEKYKDYMN